MDSAISAAFNWVAFYGPDIGFYIVAIILFYRLAFFPLSFYFIFDILFPFELGLSQPGLECSQEDRPQTDRGGQWQWSPMSPPRQA